MPCCDLCVQAFVPHVNDDDVDEEVGEETPRTYPADENGYVLPPELELDVETHEIKKPSPMYKDKYSRCCYPCASADYNAAPGDSAFGEPQNQQEKLDLIFGAFGVPANKNYRNQRTYKKDKAGLLG